MIAIRRAKYTVDGRLLAGQRRLPPLAGRWALYLRLLGHLQRVVNFDSEVPHGALELGMPK